MISPPKGILKPGECPMRYRKRIIVAGEGGQGIQVVGEILAAAAYHAGLEALYIPNFGVEQRGGASTFVQVSDAPSELRSSDADIMAVLSRRAFEQQGTSGAGYSGRLRQL